MIKIIGWDKWRDFCFLIKGKPYQCVECEEGEDYYYYRYESVNGWNYPMFEITLERRPHSLIPKIWRLGCQKLEGPASYGRHEVVYLAGGDISEWSRMEWKITDLMVKSCG